LLYAFIFRFRYNNFKTKNIFQKFIYKNYFNYEELNDIIIAICRLLMDLFTWCMINHVSCPKLIFFKKLQFLFSNEFNLPSITKTNPFFFYKNLEKSIIGLNFNLVKEGFHCDYAMP